MKPLIVLMVLALVSGCVEGFKHVDHYQSYQQYDILMDLAEAHGLTNTGKLLLVNGREMVPLYRSAVCK